MSDYTFNLRGDASSATTALELCAKAAEEATRHVGRTALAVEALTTRARDSRPEINRLANALGRLNNVQVRVDLTLPTQAAVDRLDRLRSNLERLGNRTQRIEVTAAVPSEQDIRRLDRLPGILDRLNGRRISIHVEVTGTTEALARIEALDRALGGLNDRTVNIGSSGGGRSGRRGGIFGDFSSGAAGAALMTTKLVALGVAAGTAGLALQGAVGGVLAFTAALAPAAGIVAALPATLAIAAGGFAALKIGTSGVADALKNMDDPKKFAEGLADLAPSAQSFAREVRDLSQGPLKQLKLQVQGNLFAGMDSALSRLADRTLPTLQTGLASIATRFGDLGRTLASGLSTPQAVTALRTSLASTSAVAAEFRTTVSSLTRAFITLVQGGSGPVASMFSNLSDSLRSFSNGIVRDGPKKIAETINGARTVLSQFGDILMDLGGSLGNVFKAARSQSSGLLGNLQQMTGELLRFTGGAEGQKALRDFFAGTAAAAKAVMPLLGPLVSGIGTIAGSLGDLATGAASGARAFLSGLAGALERLRPAMGPLGAAFGSLLSSLAPVLPVLGSVANLLAGAIAQGFQALAPSLPVIAGAFLGLVQALTPMVPLLAQVAGVLLTGFGQAVSALLPVLPPIVDALRVGLAPVLPVLADSFSRVAAAVAPLAAQIGGAFAQALQQIAPVLPQLVTSFTDLLIGLLPLIPSMIKLSTAMLPVIPPLVQMTNSILPPLIGLFTRIVVPIGQAAAAVAAFGVKFFPPIFVITHLGEVVGTVIPAMVGFFSRLPGQVGGALASFGGVLASVGGAALSALRNAVSGGASAVVGFFQELPGRIVGALGPLAGGLANAGAEAFRSMRRAVAAQIGELVHLVGSVPSRVVSGLGDTSRILYNAGRQVIAGFISGIGSMFGAVQNKLGALTNKLTGWKGPESLDKVILFDSGRMVIDGFINGLESRYGAVRASLGRLTGQLAPADLKAAQARALETPVQKAALEQLNAQQSLAAAQRRATAIGRVSAVSDARADAANSKTAQAKSVLDRLTASTKAGNRAEQERLQKMKEAADRASQYAKSLPNTTTAQKAAAAQARDHAAALSSQAREYARDIATGNRAESAAVDRAKATYEAAKKRSDALTANAKSAATATTDAVKAAADAADALTKAHADYADAVYAASVDKAKTQTSAMSAQIDLLVAKANDMRSAFSSGLTQGTGLTDLFGEGGSANSVTSVLDALEARVRSGQAFAGTLGTLTGAGVSDGIIQQLAAAGPDVGGAMATALLQAGPDALARLNAASASLAALAQTGMDPIVQGFYGTGISAGEQFIAGLASKFPELSEELAKAQTAQALVRGTSSVAGITPGGAPLAPSVTVNVTLPQGAYIGQASDIAKVITPAIIEEQRAFARTNGVPAPL